MTKNPQKNPIETNEKDDVTRWSSEFYEELANHPFVLGIYSSEFEDFFDEKKLSKLNQTVDNNNKKSISKIEVDYLHKFITSLRFDSSINAPFMTLEFNMKMPPNVFHEYFQNKSTKTPTTGQWIALYTKNENNFVNTSEIRQELFEKSFEGLDVKDEAKTKLVDKLYPDPSLGPSGKKAVGNADNIPGVDYLSDLFEKVNETNAENQRKVDLKNQKEFNSKIDKKFEEFGESIKDYNEKIDKLKQKHMCMFFGIVDQLTYKMISNNGIPTFDVSVRCASFMSHLEKNNYLVALPKIEENLNGAVYNKSLSEYAKNKNFKPISAFIKDIDYWNSMIKSFSSSGVSKTQNLGHEIKKILLSLQRNYLPLDMNATINNKPYLDPISNEKINENCLLTLGSIINVATEQQHLPTESSYRQMLPLVARYSSIVDRFKTTISGKGTVWDLIRGTFQTDPNLIECFPVIIPFNNKDELIKTISKYANDSKKDYSDNQFLADGTLRPSFQPFLYDNAIYKFYEQLGGIPTLIYRLKPLQPNGTITRDNINSINRIAGAKAEVLENATYSEKLVLGENLVIEYVEVDSKTTVDEVFRGIESGKKVKDRTTVKKKKINLGKAGFRDKLNLNTDAAFSKFLPSLNFDELLSFEATNLESDRVNGLYIENPAIRQKSNLTIGAFADPIINIRDAVTQGFRYYESDYPYFDPYLAQSPKEMSAINERYFAIYGGGQNRSRGIITLKMSYNPDFLVGSWIRICMNTIVENTQNNVLILSELDVALNEKIGTKRKLNDQSDFFCYIDAISYNYSKDIAMQVICTINFSRGSFGLDYAHFPNARLENHLNSKETYNEASISQYLDKQKSTKPKNIPTKQEEIKEENKTNIDTNTIAHTAPQFDKIKDIFVVPGIYTNENEDLLTVAKESAKNVEVKRFENNETTVEFNQQGQNIPLPVIEKADMSNLKFGPYKAGVEGPFPNWIDLNGDFILDEIEINQMFGTDFSKIDKIVEFNQDAKSRGFAQMTDEEVVAWQTANGYIPVP